MDLYLKQIESAVRATAIHSPTAYSWFGKSSPALPPRVKRALTPGAARNYLLYMLRTQLYTDFYCRGIAAPSPQVLPAISPSGRSPFVDQLSQANQGSGYWDPGWQVSAVEGSEVTVQKDGLSLVAQVEDCVAPEEGAIEASGLIGLRFPKEAPAISPGFYMAVSDTPPQDDRPENIVRFYWNLNAQGALILMRQITTLLNRDHIPFKLKVLNDPDASRRCDVAVLYVPKGNYGAVARVAAGIYSEVGEYMKQGVPAFTRPLSPGLAIAEDPGKGESFGQQRCRLVAEGLVNAFEQGRKSLESRVQAVVDRFADEGVSLEAPYLNPGSEGRYQFKPVQSSKSKGQSPNQLRERDLELNALQVASEIGERICRDAIWYEGRCNWLGARPAEPSKQGGPAGTLYRTLGPEVYDGAAGIALFLADLHATTGDAEVRKTALGAARQALARVDDAPPLVRLGFYTGWPGITFAAVYTGKALGDEEMVESARKLVARCLAEPPAKYETDLLSGSAGAVAGLVSLHEMLHDRALLDAAARWADDLIKRACAHAGSYSWRGVASPGRRDLTGFSHGTAGIAYALLRLYAVTDETAYRQAADMAFEYERGLFNTEEGNWPDFREQPGQDKRRRFPPSYPALWCHGAPGISLSRVYAYHALGDARARDEATMALQTTARAVEVTLQSGLGNFSLCHGLAGNTEVLLSGAHLWEPGDLPARVACAGVDRYAMHGHSWPCGTDAGETPGLMLGLAGIGHFYLRMHTPSVHTVLLP